MRSKLSILLIAAGILLAAVPIGGTLYTSYQQYRLINQWELADQTDLTTDAGSAEEAYSDLNNVFSGADGGTEVTPTPGESVTPAAGNNPAPSESPKPKPKPKPRPKQKVLGILTIKKIDLTVPVVEGVDSDQLAVGAGHIPGTAKIGDAGNCAIAGHRNYTFAQFFRYLDKLKAGDEIQIMTKLGTFKYKVYDSTVVEPTDVSVLKPVKGESTLTLITCHPYIMATQRLIIKAKLEGN